jgi:hypothetical protein
MLDHTERCSLPTSSERRCDTSQRALIATGHVVHRGRATLQTIARATSFAQVKSYDSA